MKKVTKKLKFEYSKIKIEFSLNEETKEINFLYCGLSTGKSIIKNDLQTFSKIAEIEYLSGKENKQKGTRLQDTSYARTSKYLTHSFKKNKFGKELIIVTYNDVLEVETHFQFYDGVRAITSFNIVKNISSKDVKLTSVSSFYQFGFCKANDRNNYLYQANNSWHCEAQWHKFNFLDLGILNGNDFCSTSRYSLTNVGSWSTKHFLPMLVLENKEQTALFQIENNGSWHFELGDFGNLVYVFASGPEFIDHHWLKILKPNDSFISVKVTNSYGVDFEDVIGEITKERRITRRPFEEHNKLPVIFNDYMHALWDKQTTELIKPLVDVASELGCDEFCIDAGWFAKGNQWWNILGKWEEENENFPNGGLKGLCDYIRFKNLKVGLWIEIETIGINSPILKQIKKDWLFTINDEPVVHNERYQLNFADKEVYKYAFNVVSKLIEKYGLDYLKIDYNIDSGVGNEMNSDSPGDGLLKHNRAYIKWLNEIMDKYPHLTIENCASGGCRMDYELLKYCPIQSTSDQTNYRKYPYLAANVMTACTPEQAAVWSYPIKDNEEIMPSDEVVVMNMCNAMLGRIHLASFVNLLPQKQKNLIKEGIAYYRSIVDFKKRALPIYPKGTANFFDPEVVVGLKDEHQIILCVWNTSNKKRNIKIDLSKYNVKNIRVAYPSSLETKFSYLEKSHMLNVKFDEGYAGRIFAVDGNF